MMTRENRSKGNTFMKSRHVTPQIFSLALLVMCSSALFGQSPIPPDAKLEKIATGLLQPEGPLWKDGVGASLQRYQTQPHRCLVAGGRLCQTLVAAF